MLKNKKALKLISTVVLALLVVCFVLFNLFRVGRDGIVTETALAADVYKTVDTEMYAVRNEILLPQISTGFTVPLVANGDRVGKNQPIAAVFSSEEAAGNYTRYLELEKELAYYQNIAVSSSAQYYDVSKLEKEADVSVIKYISAVDCGNLEEAEEAVNDLRASLISKQTAGGEQIDYSSIIANLSSLSSSYLAAAGGFSLILAPESGYYINYCDGFEGDITYSEAVNMTVADIDAAFLIKHDFDSSLYMGKIITEFGWYFVCNIDIADMNNITVGSVKEISLPYTSVPDFNAVVEKINDTANGKTAVIFYVSSIDADLASLRTEPVFVKIESYSGYRIPNTAIRTIDGEKGVYILRNNLVNFKKIDVLYTIDDYSVVSSPQNKSGYIKLYDEVILEGSDLYDGKLLY